MSVGFKGFAKPATIADEARTGMLGNVAKDEFVLWTGNQYGRRRASGRSACLNVVTEKMVPVALRDYVERCLNASDGKGFDTSISVGGLSLHQGAKPAVYIYLVRDAAGNFVAKKDIPSPDKAVFADAFAKGGFKGGDVVIPAAAPEVVTETLTAPVVVTETVTETSVVEPRKGKRGGKR